MEFSNRAAIAGVNFRRIEHPLSSQHIIAEVVLIDKSNDVLQPLVYYLHPESMKNPFARHDFAMAGEVIGIDKTKKIIYVRNNVTVSFKHLIAASGFKKDPSGALHDAELAAGLDALFEALKMRETASEALKFPELSHFGFENNQKAPYASPVKVKGIPVSRLRKMMNPPTGNGKSLDAAFNGAEKRLYEVVL